jgi:hypothetical protein
VTPAPPRRRLGALVLGLELALAPLIAAGEERPYGLALDGDRAERFLATAAVVAREPIGEGVTHSDRLTLSDGSLTLRAAWKTIDEHKPGMVRMENGGWEFDFRDSWKSEVAAYELDKLLGLGLVPPTVARELEGRRGSLQVWVEGAKSEKSRRARRLEPSGPREVARWTERIYDTRLLHQLTYNTDFRNVENVLIDPAFRVYVVDSSRAFRVQEDLLAPNDLERFSRTTLQRLRELDRARLDGKLGRLLSAMQIESLLKRRDKILELARKRVDQLGPGRVLFGIEPTQLAPPEAGAIPPP